VKKMVIFYGNRTKFERHRVSLTEIQQRYFVYCILFHFRDLDIEKITVLKMRESRDSRKNKNVERR